MGLAGGEIVAGDQGGSLNAVRGVHRHVGDSVRVDVLKSGR